MNAPGLFVFLLLAFSVPLSAQTETLAELKPGTRIRVAAPSVSPKRLVGWFAATRSDTLFLSPRSNHHVGIAVGQIESLDISGGKRRGRGALIGAGIGFAIDFLIATFDDDPSPSMAFIPGAVIGAVAAPERWIRLHPLTPAAAPREQRNRSSAPLP